MGPLLENIFLKLQLLDVPVVIIGTGTAEGLVTVLQLQDVGVHRYIPYRGVPCHLLDVNYPINHPVETGDGLPYRLDVTQGQRSPVPERKMDPHC